MIEVCLNLVPCTHLPWSCSTIAYVLLFLGTGAVLARSSQPLVGIMMNMRRLFKIIWFFFFYEFVLRLFSWKIKWAVKDLQWSLFPRANFKKKFICSFLQQCWWKSSCCTLYSNCWTETKVFLLLLHFLYQQFLDVFLIKFLFISLTSKFLGMWLVNRISFNSSLGQVLKVLIILFLFLLLILFR